MLLSEFSQLPLPAVLFADGVFAHPEGKTVQGVIRHSTVLRPVAVVDRSHPHPTSAFVLPGTDIPVVGSVAEAMKYGPEAFVVALTESDFGESLDGKFLHTPRDPGDLPDLWWEEIRTAVRGGLHVISCLHLRLLDTELAGMLSEGQRIVDVRRPHDVLPKYSGRVPRKRAKLIHVAGSDCVVGKRTTALQIHRQALSRGIDAGYVGTGQTCLLAGCTEGAIIDRTPVFQAAGLVEHLIQQADARHDLLIIKGQASVMHPAFGGLASAILQGSQPDAVVFAHDAERVSRYHWDHLPLADLETEIRMVEALGGAPVAAIATRGRDNVRRLRHLGLPVADVLDGDGAAVLLDAARAVWSEADDAERAGVARAGVAR
ncbi:DUF1611 domain-containing protein [Streptomyces sp. NPDC059999]|uniref:DUF1611 domain-containing protein n=1 Tax=unclassified Streptomyces TaxID=2593676 RepID=UPI002270FE5B|nr:DUF1611 domain-containing protein [Streptomyces sp. H27-G5]MCY0917454.1 DUF1611 domain-containing protein [Streptomyces sp. H27-G5]